MWSALIPAALLGASLWLAVMLVGTGWWTDQHLTGGDGQALMLESGTQYSIRATVAEGDQIACAITPMSGNTGIDRIFTAPAQKIWQRTEMTAIGKFSVSESGFYSVSCRSPGGPIGPVHIAPPNPTSLFEIGGIVVILGVVAAAAHGYSLTGRRRDARRDATEVDPLS
ncbi:hypothetical protein [Nocardia sp. NPDC046763]|uniref:hypothetical protein n=1 Tax=Nocardia sp. NPDC046763 TaxID=3155256 RepID=UPI003409E921